MSNNISGRFEISHEKEMAASYLIIKAGTDERIERYQVEMIANNPAAGVLPLDVRIKDDSISLYYNVTSRQPLSLLLQRKRLSRKDCIFILEQITQIILESKGYLLKEKGFMLQEDFIYINPSNNSVSMVYIPLEMEGDTLKNFRSLASRVMAEYPEGEEDDSRELARSISGYIRNETYNLADLNRIMAKMRVNKKETGSTTGQDDSPHNGRNIPSIQDAPKNDLPLKKDEAAVKPTVGIKTSSLVLAVLSQVIIAVVIAMSSGMLRSLGEDLVTSYIGMGIAVIAVDFLIFKRLFAGGGKIDGESSKEKTKESSVIAQHPIDMDKTALLPQKQEKKAEPYLLRSSDGQNEKICIHKQCFRIGRLKGQADYISSNNAVGKLHAEIIKKDDRLFLRDLDSRNGTFLNGAKLESGRLYLLKNNDRILFANSFYTLVIPEK